MTEIGTLIGGTVGVDNKSEFVPAIIMFPEYEAKEIQKAA